MSQTAHPSQRALAEFVAGELPPTETRQVVRHLLQGCPECQGITSQLWPAGAWRGPAVEPQLELDLELLQARERSVEEERGQAESLLEELEAHPQNRRLMLVNNSGRFHNFFLAELILNRSVDLGFQDPKRAIEHARLAVTVAERLSERRYGAALVNDIRARSWGALANVLRVGSDLVGAGEALQKAVEHLELGSGDPLEEARLLRWRANYLIARRELKAAVRLFDRGIALLRRVQDYHEMGRMLADKGVALCTAGDFEGAIRATEAALEHIDAGRAPRSVLAAKHNLSLYLHRNGDVERAMSLLQEILPVYASQNEPIVLLKLRWLEGRLAQTQRQFRRAEEAFREVQKGFIEHEIPYDAAAVSFDLAAILLEEGRLDELRELASEILGIFDALRIPRETIAALELFQRAVEGQRISVSWITELAAYVERSQSRPGQPFKPSS